MSPSLLSSGATISRYYFELHRWLRHIFHCIKNKVLFLIHSNTLHKIAFCMLQHALLKLHILAAWSLIALLLKMSWYCWNYCTGRMIWCCGYKHMRTFSTSYPTIVSPWKMRWHLKKCYKHRSLQVCLTENPILIFNTLVLVHNLS